MVDREMASPIAAKRLLIACCAAGTAVCTIALPFPDALNVTLALFTVGLAFIAAVVGSA
ncbi:hypothetical protein [Paraburkholderia rhynchosiae]|uniref:Uncharacterized protein n=1 Tax=Paraburkholderia rhynchosiae TaxID=487049 RepID=A0A6J5CB91_9BURK|nr:hypothetical protein [Paraburkholderia rhynchosiae]CAB3732700.1 hypothetical protein LMG27174_05952 [Paraburkholderia rhynchosiae]